MKRIVYLVILFIFSVSCVHAQFFAGGRFNLSGSGGTQKSGGTTTDLTSTSSISFGPDVGYYLSDELAVGAGISVSSSKQTTPGTPDDQIDKSTSFGIMPFARYYALTFNKFSVFGQGELSFSSASSKTEVGSTTTDGPKTTTIGISAFPGVAYELSDKVELEAVISGFNVSFSQSTTKQDIAGTEYTTKSNSYSLGANTNSIFTTGAITVGFIVKL